jgi:hypothetical protein
MPFGGLVSALLLLLPQSGWALTQAPPREVGRTYWELVPETEIWIRLIPEDPDGKQPLVNLVFHAFHPGRAERDPYSGLPRWPKSAAARLTVSAEPLPLTVIRELSLHLVIDGEVIDLTGPTGRYRTLPCVGASTDCTPNAVEAELEPSLLRSVVTARSVGGKALGFPIKLVAADQVAVGDFLARVGVAGGQVPRK